MLATSFAVSLPAGAALPAGSSPRAVPPPSLTITPSIIDVVAERGDALTPMTVVNGTPVAFKMRFYPALVHQLLDGSLVIRERRRELASARRRFAIHPTARKMKSHAVVKLRLRFLRPPPGRQAAYAAAVVEARLPAVRPRGASYRLRLLGALLVRTPRAPLPRGRIASVRVDQVGQRRLGFCIRLANIGRVHGYPTSLRLRVRRKGGGVVFSAMPRPGVVLPGYRRDFGVRPTRSFRRGVYVLEATGGFGASRIRGVGTFSLRGWNRLGVPRTARPGCANRQSSVQNDASPTSS